MPFRSLIIKFIILLPGLNLIICEQSYPNPLNSLDLSVNETNICNNTEISTICDPSSELTMDQRHDLNKMIKSIETNYSCTPCSSCSSGSKQLKVGMATINAMSIKEISEEKDLVLSIRKSWKLSVCENDIIILASKATKKVYLSVGNVAALHLPNQCSINIAKAASDELETSNLYESLLMVLEEIMRTYYNPLNGSVIMDKSCFYLEDDHFELKPEIIFLIALSGVIILCLIIFGIYHLQGVRRNRALNYRPEFSNFYNPSVTIDRSKMDAISTIPAQTNEMRVKSELDEEGYQEVDLGRTNTGYSM